MKTIFASAEEVPEHLKDKVTAVGDGTFVLEGDGLAKKAQELLDENKRLKRVADLLKGADTEHLTADKIKGALAEMDKAEEREQQINERIAAAVRANAESLSSKMAATEQKATKMREHLEKVLVDNSLTQAITSEGGDPFFVAPTLRGRIKVVEKDGEFVTQVLAPDGKNILLDDKGNPRSIKDLVAEAKQDKRYEANFKVSVGSGTGAPPIQGQPTGQGQGSTIAVGKDGRVILTREQAKNHQNFREAMDLVKGDMSKVAVEPDPALAARVPQQ